MRVTIRGSVKGVVMGSVGVGLVGSGDECSLKDLKLELPFRDS